MKVYLLVRDNGLEEGEMPLGLFPSVEATQDGVKDHTTPKGTVLEWKVEYSEWAPGVVSRVYARDPGDGYIYEVQEYELTRAESGSSREFDAAILRMAGEILKGCYGPITTENERKVLDRTATLLEQGDIKA